MSPRSASRLSWGLCALAVCGGLTFFVLEAARNSSDLGSFLFNSQEGLGALVFSAVGAVVASRRRDNSIGWLLLVIGLSDAVSAVGSGLTDGFAMGSRSWQWGAWLNTWSWSPAWVFMITLVLLLYPDGHLLSRRYRWAARLAVAAVVLTIVGGIGDATAGGTGYQSPLPTLPEPVAGPFELLGTAGTVVAAIASVVALVRRFRRSTGVERQQMKWFAYAGVATVVLMPARTVLVGHVHWLAVLGLLSVPFLPVAVGIAILRYRLYDIDRVVNRTLVYAVLTALLVSLYAGLVIGLGTVVGSGHPLVIAGSTLAVAALVRPARRRVQAFVDRRFYRRKYDAARTLDAFAARLRDEVDLDELREHLVEVVARTMQPAQASLWIREPEEVRA